MQKNYVEKGIKSDESLECLNLLNLALFVT